MYRATYKLGTVVNCRMLVMRDQSKYDISLVGAKQLADAPTLRDRRRGFPTA